MRCEDDELNRLTMCLLFFTRFPKIRMKEKEEADENWHLIDNNREIEQIWSILMSKIVEM